MTAARALLLIGLLGALVTEPANAMEKIIVLAAGSLRAPLTDLGHDYEKTHGVQVAFTFGASGLLRDRILTGEPADVFASANMAHPRALIDSGWAREVQPLARNILCVLARPGVAITTDTVLSVLLDPAVSVGISTPGADPGGDYAWEVFQRADAVRPGVFATLSAKARQLTGGLASPPPPSDRSVYGQLIAAGAADLFLTYCTNARLAARENSTLQVVTLPAALTVGATYGVAVRRSAPAAAVGFVEFLRSPEGKRQLATYGFAAP